MERTPNGTRPLAGAGVNLWVDAGRYGYSYWWANGQVYSDSAGNFQLSDLPPATGWLEAWKDGYVHQCALPPINLNGDVPNMEITFVSRDRASVDVSAVPADASGRIIAGRIVENTPEGVQPVAGAFVDFEPVMDFPAATTYSDAEGRYLLCGVTEGDIGVGFNRRVTYASVPRGLIVDNFDIVLP